MKKTISIIISAIIIIHNILFGITVYASDTTNDYIYKYNEENTLGTFMMAAGFPKNIKIESVGIAFYYKSADMFDPRDNFTLLLNNKMMIGRFNTEQLEDIYIINMHNMTSAYNLAARGFVTYYNSDGNLVTEYSNQINIIDRQNADEIKA